MNSPFVKYVPTLLVSAVVAWCCWPYMWPSEDSLESSEEVEELVTLEPSALAPDLSPVSNRNPFPLAAANNTARDTSLIDSSESGTTEQDGTKRTADRTSRARLGAKKEPASEAQSLCGPGGVVRSGRHVGRREHVMLKPGSLSVGVVGVVSLCASCRHR